MTIFSGTAITEGSHDGPLPAPAIAIAAYDARAADLAAAPLRDAGLTVAAVVADLGAVDDVAALRPALAVLAADLRAPAALAALRRIHRLAPEARIVVVACGAPSRAAARESLNAGAEAFVPESAAAEALVPAVLAVLAGLVCAPRAERRLVAKPTFSQREKEVLALLVAGLSNKQIAGRLYLSESTVKTHLVSAFAKLGVRSRKDAAALLLDPAEGLAATALQPQRLVEPAA